MSKNTKISVETQAILNQVDSRLAKLKQGTECPRCDGDGERPADQEWVNVRVRTTKSCKEGKICFLCKGVGTVSVNVKKSALAIGLAYYHSVASTGKVDFGTMIHQNYVKGNHSVYKQAIRPLIHHINRVLVAKAIAGELEWVNDPLCWDERCYSYIGHALTFADLVPVNMRS